MLINILSYILSGVAIITLAFLYNQYNHYYVSGRFTGLVFGENSLFILCHIEGSTRIVLLNKYSGKVIQKKILNREFKIVAVMNEVVWLESYKDLIALHTVTLEKLFNLKDIGNSLPKLQNIPFAEFKFYPKQKAVELLTETGYYYMLDGETFEVCPKKDFKAVPTNKTEKEDKPNDAAFSIQDVKDSKRETIVYNDKLIDANLSFLRPKILNDTINKHILMDENTGNVFVLHYEGLNGNADIIISAISRETGLLWSVFGDDFEMSLDDNSLEVAFATLDENILILVLKGKKYKAVKIDSSTGRIHWQYWI
jgi:hypothetical protein